MLDTGIDQPGHLSCRIDRRRIRGGRKVARVKSGSDVVKTRRCKVWKRTLEMAGAVVHEADAIAIATARNFISMLA